MVKTRALKESLTSRGHRWGYYRGQPRFMEIGTKDPVGNLHAGKGARTRRVAVVSPTSDSLAMTLNTAKRKHLDMYAREWSTGHGL